MISRTPVAGIVGALAAMRDRASSEQLLPTLADIPTLVMVGEADSVTPPDTARAMAQLIPGARLVVIPGAGHLASMEQPEKVNDQLRDFLSSLP
jgi:pimeloyl-ACP methyl ester carboxylesterase